MEISLILSWSGCFVALVATAMLAIDVQGARWAWVLFTVANCCWVVFGVVTDQSSLIIMNLGFMLTSVGGITRTFYIEPRRLRLSQRQPT